MKRYHLYGLSLAPSPHLRVSKDGGQGRNQLATPQPHPARIDGGESKASIRYSPLRAGVILKRSCCFGEEAELGIRFWKQNKTKLIEPQKQQW
jgi:hypothetical protein